MRDEGVIYVYWIGDVQDSQGVSASEMTYIVSGGALNSTYALSPVPGWRLLSHHQPVPSQMTAIGWHPYASRQPDVHQLRRQSAVGIVGPSRPAALEQSAVISWTCRTAVDIQWWCVYWNIDSIARPESVFKWAGKKYCHLLTYLLTYDPKLYVALLQCMWESMDHLRRDLNMSYITQALWQYSSTPFYSIFYLLF